MKRRNVPRMERSNKPEGRESRETYFTITVPTFQQPKKKFQWGKRPWLDSEWESISEAIVEWAQKDESLFLQEFPLMHGYSPTKFLKWVELNETFSNAVDYARNMLGMRREGRAMTGEIDKSMVITLMPLYNPEYREYKESQENKNDHKSSITVVMEPAPDVGVPRREPDVE